MEITMPWGSGSIQVQLPDTWNVILPGREQTDSRKRPDELALVKASLRRPIGAKPLAGRKLRGKKIVIIVDDNTRPTPVHRYFHLVLEDLKKAGAL